jgi:hypothetical protein
MHVVWRLREGKKATSRYCHLAQSKRVGSKVETQVVAYIGSVSLQPTKPETQLFWMQVKSVLEELNLTAGERAKIKAALAQKVPRGKHDLFISSKSDEYCTPIYFLFAVIECMGGIDLDPASNSKDHPHVPATNHLTIEDDAITQPWEGKRVFLNPPFSCVAEFIPKLMAEISCGRVSEAIVLTKSDTRTNWYKQLRQNSQALCFAEGYHRFGDAENSATFGVLFSYFGDNPTRFREVFKKFGVCSGD